MFEPRFLGIQDHPFLGSLDDQAKLAQYRRLSVQVGRQFLQVQNLFTQNFSSTSEVKFGLRRVETTRKRTPAGDDDLIPRKMNV